MKNVFIILLILFYFHISFGQEALYKDENGQAIDRETYFNNSRDSNLSLSSWKFIDENGTENYTSHDKFLKGNFIYEDLIFQLEKIINRKASDNTILLLEYIYKDDFCSKDSDNKWTKRDIAHRKKYHETLRVELNKRNITYITLFEEGIILKNKPEKDDEYFFIDKNNYFKTLLFTQPTLCGSFSLIKPNGQTIIRNGEFDPEMMVEFLTDDNWLLFFKAND